MTCAFTYLTDGSKDYLETFEAVRLSILRPVLLSTQFLVTAEAAEMVEVPVLSLGSSVLSTDNELREGERGREGRREEGREGEKEGGSKRGRE